jgi:hypothetical protein
LTFIYLPPKSLKQLIEATHTRVKLTSQAADNAGPFSDDRQTIVVVDGDANNAN